MTDGGVDWAVVLIATLAVLLDVSSLVYAVLVTLWGSREERRQAAWTITAAVLLSAGFWVLLYGIWTLPERS